MVGRVRAGEGCRRVGVGLKYLKKGWNRKEARGNKHFKKGETRSRGGYLKGSWNPDRNY